MMKSPLIATLCATLALGAAAVPVQAGEIKVTYADLNLATAAGQKALEARIDRAAKDACGYGELHTGTRIANREIITCYRKAKKQATAQMASVIASARYGG